MGRGPLGWRPRRVIWGMKYVIAGLDPAIHLHKVSFANEALSEGGWVRGSSPRTTVHCRRQSILQFGASSFETHRYAMLLRIRSWTLMMRSLTLMLRSAAAPRDSNHEATDAPSPRFPSEDEYYLCQ